MPSAPSCRVALRQIALTFATLLLATAATAEESQAATVPPEVSTAEITYLMTEVENSDCLFTSNGRTHKGEKAAKHLRKKYNYGLRKYDHITAEQFIEHIASKSSWTGKPYRIRCGDEEVNAGDWFTALLAERRNHATD